MLNRTTGKRVLTAFQLLGSLCMLVLLSAGCASQSNASVNATVDAAVCTTAAKAQWFKGSREFFLVETDVLEVASALQDIYQSMEPGAPATIRMDYGGFHTFPEKRPEMNDRLVLLPLPGDTVGRAIKADLLRAFRSLEAFHAGVSRLVVLYNSTPTGTNPTREDVWQSNQAFADSWQRGRDRLLTCLSQIGISTADLGLD